MMQAMHQMSLEWSHSQQAARAKNNKKADFRQGFTEDDLRGAVLPRVDDAAVVLVVVGRAAEVDDLDALALRQEKVASLGFGAGARAVIVVEELMRIVHFLCLRPWISGTQVD